MKIIKPAILLLFILAIISCSSSEEPAANKTVTNTSSSGNTALTPDETSEADPPPANQTFEMKEVYPVKSYSQKTPTDTLKTFAKATINKDAEGVRKTLSKGSMKMIEESAAAQNVNVETILLNENENSLTEVPEMKNEKITGNTATVEVQNKVTKGFDVMPLIKEDGEWKLALDKFMEEAMQKLTEDMNEPPPPQKNK